MKRILSLLLAVMMLATLAPSAFAAADTQDDKVAELEAALAERDAAIEALEAKVAELEALIESLQASDAEEAEAAPAEEPAAQYETLQKGSKGEEARALQRRLIELNYLSGGADGDYGQGTANAVSAFQHEVGLPETGVADDATQRALYASDAPKAKIYQSLDYTGIARDPDTYTGNLVVFNGKILQVMENDTLAVFRIATKGSYDNVVYCVYEKPENYSRFLEDDHVTVYAVCTGVYTYTAVRGNEITIPSCRIDRIELR